MSIRKLLSGAAMLLAASSASAQDATTIISEKMMENCPPGSQQALSGMVRDAIELKVKQSEAYLLPPSPVGELGCLQDLMNAPLDLFSNVGGLMGTLQGNRAGSINAGAQALASVPGAVRDAVAAQVCSFAAEKWANLTEPLNVAMSDLENASGSLSNVWDNFNLDPSFVRSGNAATGTASSGSSQLREGDLAYTPTARENDPAEDTSTLPSGMTADEALQVILRNLNSISGSDNTIGSDRN